MIDKLVIIGVGLIGGSIASALKKANYSKIIIGYGRDEQKLIAACDLGIIDDYSTDFSVVVDANIVILATPVASFASILENIKPYLGSNTIITDTGSVKGDVCNIASTILANNGAKFIGAHPIAGKENNGYLASDIMLFNNKKVVITPLEANKDDDIASIVNMWQQTGAIVEKLDITKHDNILAATSHLPHILAFSLMNYLSDNDAEVYDYAAGGFKDFSRIASSDSTMWADICIANKAEILTNIDGFSAKLATIAQLIKNNDKQQLKYVFKMAKQERDNWLKKYE